MFVTLKGNDIVTVLRGIPTITSLLPGGIKYEKELREIDGRPYMYVEKTAFPDKSVFNRDMIITLTIVGDNMSISSELETIFEAVDNSILSSVDGCLPIRDWVSAEVSTIRQSFEQKPMRDDKNNLILSKDYIFTYIIHD